jgi:hypothetical protein
MSVLRVLVENPHAASAHTTLGSDVEPPPDASCKFPVASSIFWLKFHICVFCCVFPCIYTVTAGVWKLQAESKIQVYIEADLHALSAVLDSFLAL